MRRARPAEATTTRHVGKQVRTVPIQRFRIEGCLRDRLEQRLPQPRAARESSTPRANVLAQGMLTNPVLSGWTIPRGKSLDVRRLRRLGALRVAASTDVLVQ